MTLKVLVTGGSGFLGSHLVRQLVAQGWNTTALLRERSETTNLQAMGVMDRITVARMGPRCDGLGDIVQRARPDIVIHTAAFSRSSDSVQGINDLIESNILFPALLLAHMRDVGCETFVNTGTSWQNCDGANFSPFNVYAASKQALEDLVQSFCLDGLRAITLRLFDTYGPGDTRNKIIDLVIRAMLTGQPLKMSPGEQILDLAHIDDVARAFVIAAQLAHSQSAPGHVVYAAPGHRIILRDFAAMVGKLADREMPIIWGGRPYRPREVMVPFEGLTPLLGWHPIIDFRTGILAQIEFWRSELDGTPP